MSESNSFYALRDLVWSDKPEARKRLSAEPSLRFIRSGLGETLLHFFAVEDCREEVEWLLARGVPLNTVNHFGSSPLLEAVQLGYVGSVALLLEKGADPRPVNNLDETALSVARERGDTALIALLEAALAGWEGRPEPLETAPTPGQERQRLDAWLKKSARKPRR